jgi:hypothetical protein
VSRRALSAAGPITGLALLAAVRVSLRVLGLRRTVRLARRAGERSARARSGSADDLARSVATAAAFFPGRAVCLEQSIALYVLLRRRGHPAGLRIGVQPYPFQAHAWVEVDGRPVAENEETIRRLVAFPEAFA